MPPDKSQRRTRREPRGCKSVRPVRRVPEFGSLRIVIAIMLRKLQSVVKFAIVMLAMTIACTIVWQGFVADSLYDCTDSVSGDFLRPGDWVHAFDGNSIVPVQHVVHGRSMSEPDTIKKGWSVTDLWLLWFAFLGVSVAVSGYLARKRWFPVQDKARNHLDCNKSAMTHKRQTGTFWRGVVDQSRRPHEAQL